MSTAGTITPEHGIKDRNCTFALRRMSSAGLREQERFHLKLFLPNIAELQSHNDMRTVNGIVLDTFK